jgi:formate--tetrahydrofolate ligase
MALKLGDYIVTEGGFGGDLGAEKFYNIVCRAANLKPSCCVIVATARALKCHGGVGYKEAGTENLEALEKGLGNLEQHIENMMKFGVPSVVAINEFPTDTPAEVDLIEKKVAAKGANVVISRGWAKGGEGTKELATKVVEVCDSGKANFKPLYDVNESIEAKVTKICTEIYRADGVDFLPLAKEQAEKLAALGLDKLPICMAKTQYSFSDNPKLLGAPRGFRVTVKEMRVSNGAGFIVVLTGDIMTMPGLPKEPAANRIDILDSGEIVGLF